MLSNVNLLKDLPSQTTSKYLSSTFLQLTSIGFIVLLLIIYLVNLSLYFNAKNNLENLTTTQTNLVKQLTQLQEQISYAKIATAAAANMDFAATTPRFSLYLKKLAAYTPYGIWLTSINLNQTNGFISLTGQAIKSFSILEFIKNITQYRIFNNQHLSNIKLQRDAKKNILSFSLSNVESKKQ